MECRSPSVPVLGQQISPEEPLSLDYGFLMDDVPSVRNLSHSPNFPKFVLYPDPVYEKFDEEVKYYKSDYLTINGINLDRACQVTFNLTFIILQCVLNCLTFPSIVVMSSCTGE
jgi:plexin A